MSPRIEELRTAVQNNCNIADAQHAGNYSMCVYLLKMREYFRWELGYEVTDVLPKAEIGPWLAARESLWADLEMDDFGGLPVAGARIDPFETGEINACLVPQGMVYSGGVSDGGRPHFFLGELFRQEQRGDFQLLVSGHELARDLAAFPAMTQAGTIFIRRESLRRMLWEHVEQWRWNKPDNAMARAISCYDFDNDVATALDTMTDCELENVVLHEVGEVRAGELLGSVWPEMMTSLPRSRAVFMLRAVRDHIADCISTLPALLDQLHIPSMHFYFGNLEGMRKETFPRLMAAYNDWQQGGSIKPLQAAVATGREHWRSVASEALEMYTHRGTDSIKQIEALIESRTL